jgi:hypothetical protein
MTEQQTVLRAKMRVQAVTQTKAPDGSIQSEQINLSAVYDPDPNSENGQWSQWTPAANLNITINNPSAFNKVSSGHEYFVDLIPVE